MTRGGETRPRGETRPPGAGGETRPPAPRDVARGDETPAPTQNQAAPPDPDPAQAEFGFER